MQRTAVSVRIFAAALLGLLGAVPSRADVDIQIQGVDGDLRRNVLILLSLERYRNRDDLDEALIARLQERTEREASAALRPFGYYDPKVTTTIDAVGPGRWRARIDIDPRAPVVLAEVLLDVRGPGATNPAFRRILEARSLRTGARLQHALYDGIKDELRRTAATLGYAEATFARSELEVDAQNRRAQIALVLDTGPRYSFGKTRVEEVGLDEDFVRRYLRFAQGAPYDAGELLRTQFALDDSQYFSSVEVISGTPDPDTHTIPVDIRTEPNRRNRYTVGAGFATDTKARGTLGWENRRLNDRGHRFRADLKAAQLEQSLEARYLLPIGDPALEKLELEFRQSRDDLGDLETRTTRFRPAVTQVLGAWQRVFFASLARTRTITTETALSTSIAQSTTLVIPGVSYASVPRGYLGEALFSRTLSVEVRGSARTLGANSDYLQLRLDAERVLDLAPKWHVFLRGQLGITAGSSAADLPGTERFFAGGDRSVRGFGYNDLSPTDAGGAKIGGRHLFTGTAEVIRDLPRNFGLAAFVDTGSAFDRFGDPLQYSAGIGLRVRLPVVTLGIDIAQPLSNPSCRNVKPDPRCGTLRGFDALPGPRLHLNFSPKL
ncbi:MAG: autotransporter assembly complex protein TamA [Steroidobacteraceae bacterium]|jgi:translocation and assembly module TamA